MRRPLQISLRRSSFWEGFGRRRSWCDSFWFLLPLYKRALDFERTRSLFQISRDLLTLHTLYPFSILRKILTFFFSLILFTHFYRPQVPLNLRTHYAGNFSPFSSPSIFSTHFYHPLILFPFFLHGLLGDLLMHILNWRIRSRAQWYWESMEGWGWAHNMGQ